MAKKVLLALASVFLIWQTVKLLSTIHEFNLDSIFGWFIIAWIINLFITGIFAFAGFAFPTQKLLPESYYRIKKPKKLQAGFELLKVDLFRKFLLATFWRNQQQRKNYFNGKKDGIATLVEQSMKSEFGHLIPLIIITIVCGYFVQINLITLTIFTLLFNIIGNLYPIILQRHHRMRIQLISERQQARKVK